MLPLLKKRWVYHTLTWVTGAILTSEASIDPNNLTASLTEAMLDILVFFFPLACCTYIVLYLKEQCLPGRRYFLFAGLFAIAIALGLALYQLEYYLLATYSNYLRQDAQNLFFSSLIAIGLQHFKRDLTNQYRLKELQAKNAEIELAALKTQLNPHFLFNSLNNIYGVVQEDTPKGADMILGLADVMRYYLQSSSRVMINLSEEILLIESYVALEAVRLNDNCNLTLQVEQENQIGQVAPLLLLPFIENAFKHGTHPLRPCFVTIRLNVMEDTIYFSVINSNVGNTRVIKTGIGLSNTIKRLNLIYPDSHRLIITEEDEEYSVELEIPLST